jgi:hypothetical protein
MTYLIDNEDALCRYLASRTWTQDFVSPPEKELAASMKEQERIRKFKETGINNALIMSRKGKAGGLHVCSTCGLEKKICPHWKDIMAAAR